MQLPMAKGLQFPPCFLNEAGVLDVSPEGTFPLRDVHVTNWHLVEQRDIEVDPELRHHFGLDGESSATNGRA